MKYDYKYFTEKFEPHGFVVFSRDRQLDSDCNIFDIYVKDSPMGVEWFGEFSIVYKNGFLVYSTNIPNPTIFDNSVGMLIAIKEYNDSRVCPACYYAPCHIISYNVCDAFVWYMKTLGFVMPEWDEGGCNNHMGGMDSSTMVLKNWLGEIICRLSCIVDHKTQTPNGAIMRSIGNGFTWMESEFDSIEGMIASVNSLLEPDMLITAAQKMSVTSKLTDTRTDNVQAVKVDDCANVYVMNAKNAIKSALETALKNLES